MVIVSENKNQVRPKRRFGECSQTKLPKTRDESAINAPANEYGVREEIVNKCKREKL